MSYMRALEPGDPCEVWLVKHDDTPIETRPVFIARAPSGREQRKLGRDFDATTESETFDAIQDAVTNLFCEWVVGWRNFDCEFSREAIEEKTTYHGQREILRRILAGAVSPEDKKKLE